MPIYGYACKSCDHAFDVLQKMSDPRLVDCPECGESSLQKQLSAPKFRLKGEGWYETDFKTGDKRNLAGDSDTKADSKSDSKKTADAGKVDTPAKVEKKTDSKATGSTKSDSKASSA